MQNIDFSDRSPKRNVPMVRMDIESTTLQSLPNGNLAAPGKSTIKIYKDQVQQVMDLTRTEEDNERLKRAREEFQLRYEKFVEKECAGDRKLAEDTCPISVESVYVSQNEGFNFPHVKPLLSAKIVEDNLPPPQEEGKWNSQAEMAKLVTTVVAQVLQVLGADKRAAQPQPQVNSGNKQR